MESLELKIITPMEPGALPEIQWNIEEAKAYTLKKAKEYQGIAYTDADASAMKKDRAQINKFITAVENERKRAKAFYNEPYEKFNAQVKEVLQPMRDTIQIIDQGLDEIEQKYRDGKTDLCRKYYDRHIGELKGLLPFERTIREEYYKRAFTPGKLEQAYMDFFGRIREDLKALDELPEWFWDKAALEYMKSFSLSDALREGKRLEEMEKAMEERRQAQEKKMASQTAQEAPAAVLKPDKQEGTAKEAAHQDADQILHLDFRVWGTKTQLMGLRQYLIDNGLKFGKVE